MNWNINLVDGKRVKGFDELIDMPLHFDLPNYDARLLRFSFNKCSVSFELLLKPDFLKSQQDGVQEIVAYMQCYNPRVGFLHMSWGCFAPIDYLGVFHSGGKFVVNLAEDISIECQSIIFKCHTVRLEERILLDKILIR